jgi:hypothetical protein
LDLPNFSQELAEKARKIKADLDEQGWNISLQAIYRILESAEMQSLFVGNNIWIRESYDYIELYKNGKIVAEGHSLSIEYALNALGIEYNRVYVKNDTDWYNGIGKPNQI